MSADDMPQRLAALRSLESDICQRLKQCPEDMWVISLCRILAAAGRRQGRSSALIAAAVERAYKAIDEEGELKNIGVDLGAYGIDL